MKTHVNIENQIKLNPEGTVTSRDGHNVICFMLAINQFNSSLKLARKTMII